MIIINSLNESRFTLNGIQFFKNYISKIAGDKIKIFNCYENSDVLVDFTEYTDIELNGTTYESAEALQAAIIDVIYSRLTAGGSSSPVLNQNNVGRYFIFGELIGEGDITNTQAVAWLNSQPFFLIFDETKTPIFFVFTRGGKKYIFVFLDGKGKWGNSPPLISDVNPYSVNNVKILSIFNTEPDDVTDNPGATIIDLGNLPTGNYLLAANSTERDFSDAGTFDENGNIVTYYFSYTQEEVLYFVQFVGAAGIYSGTLTEADLVATTNSNVAPVNQNNTGVKINIGNFYVNPLTPLEQTVTKVNTQYPLNISEIQSPVLLYGIKLETPPGFTGPGSPPAIPTVKYWFLFLGGKGSWGIGGTPITSAMLYALPSENLQPDDITESDTTEIIPLGNIESTDNFLSTANSEERDFSDEEMTYYFSYTVTEGEGEDAQDVLYITIFVGEPGTYGGSTGNNFVEGDFIGITNSIISPTVIPNLQSVLESGSIATIVTGWQITSDDGSDISTVGAGTDGIGFSYNDNFLNIENDLVTINSRVQIQPAISDNQAVTKGQLDAKTGFLDDLYIATTGDNNILYKTDTQRFLDLNALVTGLTITRSNDVVRLDNNDLGIIVNAFISGTPASLVILKDCYIDGDNILQTGSVSSVNLPIENQTSMIYHRGYIYTLDRTDNTTPPTIVKINPYYTDDIISYTFPTEAPFNLGTTPYRIKAYNENIYMFVGSGTLGGYFIKIKNDLASWEQIFTLGNSTDARIRYATDYVIYEDEVYFPTYYNLNPGGDNSNRYNTMGINVYDFAGNLKREVNLQTILTGNTGLPYFYWMAIYNDKIITAIVSATGGSIVRHDTETLILEETYVLEDSPNLNNSIDKEGNVTICSYENSDKVVKFKYDDFAGTYQELTHPSGVSLAINGSINYINPYKSKTILKTSDLIQDVATGGDTLPYDFFAAGLSANGTLKYKTDTYRDLDVDALVAGTTIDGINEVLRDENRPNDLFLICNSTEDTTDATPISIVGLLDCKIIGNVLTVREVQHSLFTVQQRTHGVKIKDGFIYLSTRVENDNLGTIPTELFKINAYDLSDYNAVELPLTPYNGRVGEISIYGNYVYMLMYKFNGSSPANGYIVRFNIYDITDYSLLFDCVDDNHTRNIAPSVPFTIYRDEIYIPTLDTTSDITKESNVGITVFDLDGNLKRELLQPITRIEGNYFHAHWITIFNNKIIVTPTNSITGNKLLVRIDATSLELEENITLAEIVTDDNSLFSDGNLYLNGEESASSNLYRYKYDDFTDTSIEQTDYKSLGSIVPYAHKPLNKQYLSEFINNSFIPLTGTTEGNPVTGDIQVEESVSIFHENEDYGSGIALEDGGFTLYGSTAAGNYSNLSYNQSSNSFSFETNILSSRGLSGGQDFTPNIQSLDYVQKKYVDTHAPRILHNDVTDSTTITGTTTNTIIKSYLIPANTLSAGTLSFVAKYLKIGSNDNVTLTAYIRSSDTLSGTDGRIGTWTPIVTSRQFIEYGRTITIKADGSTYNFPEFISNQYGESDNSSTSSGITIDFEVDNYIIFTIQNANADDAMVQKSAEVIFKKSTN
ncbi:hypothetical protein GWA97_10735 [Flavobacterium sp. LaA7.5]|nr:hypothetical protein [Flavobacterium salilacus subsp. altitudinum]